MSDLLTWIIGSLACAGAFFLTVLSVNVWLELMERRQIRRSEIPMPVDEKPKEEKPVEWKDVFRLERFGKFWRLNLKHGASLKYLALPGSEHNFNLLKELHQTEHTRSDLSLRYFKALDGEPHIKFVYYDGRLCLAETEPVIILDDGEGVQPLCITKPDQFLVDVEDVPFRPAIASEDTPGVCPECAAKMTLARLMLVESN